MTRATTAVVSAGAGPTGLTLAVDLARRGVAIRVVDPAPERSRHSKALVLHPRTLEALDRLGLADVFAAEAQPVVAITPSLDGRRLGSVSFPPADGPHPRPVMLRQSRTEALLEAELERLGGRVERGVRLTALREAGDHVEATLSGPGGDESLRCAYLAGCDGAHSTVRGELGVPFEGHQYASDFVQADVRVDWPLASDGGYGWLGDHGVLAAIPLGGGVFRFIAMRPERPPGSPDVPTLEEFQAAVERHVPGARLHSPEWIVRFSLHERLVPRLRVGRVFLAGDAAHIHSPAGGQGMNTGMLDAFNLGWRLSAALDGLGGDELLEGYHSERHPIDAAIVAMTDRLFRIVLRPSRMLAGVRRLLVPLVFRAKPLVHRLMRRMTQLGLGVRHGGQVADLRGFLARGPRAGDRAPDAAIRLGGRPARLFDVFRTPRWVALVDPAHPIEGDAPPPLRQRRRRRPRRPRGRRRFAATAGGRANCSPCAPTATSPSEAPPTRRRSGPYWEPLSASGSRRRRCPPSPRGWGSGEKVARGKAATYCRSAHAGRIRQHTAGFRHPARLAHRRPTHPDSPPGRDLGGRVPGRPGGRDGAAAHGRVLAGCDRVTSLATPGGFVEESALALMLSAVPVLADGERSVRLRSGRLVEGDRGRGLRRALDDEPMHGLLLIPPTVIMDREEPKERDRPPPEPGRRFPSR